MMRQRDLDLRALLPGSISGDATVMALAESIGQELRTVAGLVDLVRLYQRLDEQTEPVLSLLAWQFNVLFWDASLADGVKRTLIRKAIPWRKIHGTPACVEEAVTAVFGEPAIVVPWYRYAGVRGKFLVEVEISVSPLRADVADKALAVVKATKNARSHLDELRIVVAGRCGAQAACSVQTDEVVDVYPWTLDGMEAMLPARAAAGVHVVETLECVVE
jgi:phage tail P2-like protein